MATVIPDYPSNSGHQNKQCERKRMEKITTGEVKTTKHSTSNSIVEVFAPVIADAIVPTLKDALVSIITNGINILVYGDSDSSGSSRPISSISYGHTNYSRISTDRKTGGRPNAQNKNRQNFDDLIFESRGEAQIVLDELRNAIDKYGVVTVLDAYDLCGETAPYTSDKYGWMNLENAYIERNRQGYVIRFPRAVPID